MEADGSQEERSSAKFEEHLEQELEQAEIRAQAKPRSTFHLHLSLFRSIMSTFIISIVFETAWIRWICILAA